MIPQSSANEYAPGNCTFYVASVFPMLAGDLGNAGDWIANAHRHGYTVLNRPAPNTVVVYAAGDGYSQYGHVAVVKQVNPDGSFIVSEMNYNGWDLVDERTSSMHDVAGFIVPPGEVIPASYTSAVVDTASQDQSASGPCGKCISCSEFSLPGTTLNVCWDAPIALAGFLFGGALLFGGVAILVSFALKHTKVGAQALEAGSLALGPVGAATGRIVARQQEQEQARKAASKTASTEARAEARADRAHERRMEAQEARQAHQVRMFRARARATRRKRAAPKVDVAVSARQKAQQGRFSEFTPEEVNYAQRNQSTLFN